MNIIVLFLNVHALVLSPDTLTWVTAHRFVALCKGGFTSVQVLISTKTKFVKEPINNNEVNLREEPRQA